MENINTFQEGMNKDLAKSLLKAGSYINAENLSLVTDVGLSTATLRNIKGNEYFINIPDCSNVVQISSVTPGTVSLVINYGSGFFTVSVTVNSLLELGQALQNDPRFANNNLAVAYTQDNIVIYSTLVNNLLVTPVIFVQGSGFNYNNNYVPFISSPKIVGWTMLRDQIIIFTTENSDENPVNKPSQIWNLTYDKHTEIATIKLIYNANLNLSLSHPIANPGGVVGNYETDSIQKIYWTDNYNKPKILNIADINAMALFPDSLDVNPSTLRGVATLYEVIDSGAIKTGIYQVSARFSVISGSISTVLVPSNPITIVNAPEVSTFETYEGRDTGSTVSKSISARLYNLDTKYDLVEPIVIYKETKDSSPSIYLLPAQPITGSGEVTFKYTGSETVIPLSTEEFLEEGLVFDTVKTVASKNNMLFFGNTKYSDFDVDFDCRAYRFSGNNATNPRTAVIRNLTSTSFTTIYGTNPNWSIGKTEDAIQDINAQAPDTAENYLFQSDGLTYGGEGPNVTYEFVPMYSVNDRTINSQYRTIIDDSNKAWTGYKAPYASVNKVTKTTNFSLDTPPQTGYTQASQSLLFGNSAGPFGSYTVRGYQRDEMYRFGIVFFSKKGQPSYVHWIADIRMPKTYMPSATAGTPNNRSYLAFPISSVDDPTKANNTNSTAAVGAGVAYANNLGIKFTVKNLQSIANQISGYSIVRVKREESDKTILGQGILNPIFYSGNNFDCCEFWTVSAGQDWTVQTFANINNAQYTSQAATLASPDFLFKGNPSYAPYDQIDIVQVNKAFQTFTVLDSSGIPCANSTSYKFYLAWENGLAPKAATFNTSNPTLNKATPINICETQPLSAGGRLSVSAASYSTGTVKNWGWTGALNGTQGPEICNSCPDTGYNNQVSRGVGGSRLFVGVSNCGTVGNSTLLDSIAVGAMGVGNTWPDLIFNDSITAQYGYTRTVSAATYNPAINTITYTTTQPHYFVAGQTVTITGLTPSGYNLIAVTVTSTPTSTTFTVIPAAAPSSNTATGTGTVTLNSTSTNVYLANYRRPNIVQYGGNSYSARSYNEYIPTGHVQLVNNFSTTNTDMVFGGDTYITLFDYAEQLRNPRLVYYSGNDSQLKYSKTRNTIHLIPVECSFPVELRKNVSGPTSDGYTATPRRAPNKSIAYADLPGSISANNAGNPDTAEWFENFETNVEYIGDNDVMKFFPLPYPYIDTTKFDVRVHRSQIKTNGELTDSWGIFKSNDYIDVDTSQGSLNNLIIYQNTLIGFQDKGVVQLSVKDRAIAPDISGSELILGTGGILENYTYISKIIGTRHQFSFTTSHDAVFWFDMNTKNMYKMSGGAPIAITVAKGMSSYLNNNLDGIIQVYDNPFLDKGITATYDFRYNEAIMTFKDIVRNDINSFSGVIVSNPSTSVYNVSATNFTNWALIPNVTVVCYVDNDPNAYTGFISSIAGNIATIQFDTNPPISVGNTITVFYYIKKAFTLAYNDFIDAYTSFYSFTPSVYLNDQAAIFSPATGLNRLYRHDIGDHGVFYGIGPYKSTLKLIVNPYPTETKVFDNYEMVTEVIDLATGANIVDDTFDRIRLYDDYQNSDFQSLPIDNAKQTAKRKERTWNISNIRNRVIYNVGSPDIFASSELSTPLEKEQLPISAAVPYTTIGERFRDKYLIVDLEYDNLNDYRLIMHTFKTHYRKSAR